MCGLVCAMLGREACGLADRRLLGTRIRLRSYAPPGLPGGLSDRSWGCPAETAKKIGHSRSKNPPSRFLATVAESGNAHSSLSAIRPHLNE